MVKHSYAIITPAYNESLFLPYVIRSIVEQIQPPDEWIIVDDRSTDNTWSVITEAAERYSFIKPLKISGDKTRRLGANVVHVFNEGYQYLSIKFDFIVKLDADSVLPNDYFNCLLNKFSADSRIGMASGKTFIFQDNVWKMEKCPDYHVMGACKMYRYKCFEDIEGLIPVLGWDKIDCAKARMKGWKTCSFKDMPIYHLRQMGAAMGMMKTYISYGRTSYFIRESFLFIIGRSIYRSIEYPYFSSFFMIIGYLIGMIRHDKKFDDKKLCSFYRKEQLSRVFGLKWKHERMMPVSKKQAEKVPDGFDDFCRKKLK